MLRAMTCHAEPGDGPTRSCSASPARCAPPACRSPRTAPRASSPRSRCSGSTTSGRRTSPAGPRCAPGPTTSSATTRSSRRYFNARDGLPRAAAGRAAVADASPACRWPRRAAPATATTDDEVVRAMASDDRGAAAPRRRDADAPAEKHRLAAMFATLRPRPPRAAYRPAPALAPRRTSTPPARCAASCAGWASPATSPGGAAASEPRRVVLLVDVSGSMSGYADALLRLAHRFTQVAAEQRRRGRDVHRRHPAHPPDPGDADARRRAGAGRRRRDRAGLVGRHPARRDAAVLPRPVGPARAGPRRGGRRVQRRLGARRPGAARRADGAAAAGSRTASCGSTRTAARPATSRSSRAWSPRCRTSTTSSPATRWRRSPSCRRWSPVRDVLPELMKWWRGRRDRRRRHRRRDLPVGPAPGRRLDAGRPRRHGGRLGLRRLRRGRGLRAGPGGRRRPATPVLERYGVSDDDAFAVGLTCGGILDVYVEKVNRRRRSPSSARSPTTSRPAARSPLATVIEHPDPAWLGRRLVVRPEAIVPTFRSAEARRTRPNVRDYPVARLAAGRRRRPRRRARAAGGRAQRDADLRPRRRAARRGDAGVRVGVRAQAADAGVRRDRLRGGGGPGRQLPRLPRDRLRRPARVRDQHPLPRGRRGGRRLAAPLPRRPRPRPAGSTRAP